MNSIEALDFAIVRLNRNLIPLQRLLNDPRRDQAQTAADIEQYTAAVETLQALRDLIAERAEVQA